MISADSPATRLATRLSFLVAGFGISCWAPLIPFVKQQLMIDDATLGLLLLCLGVGSIGAMILTGAFASRCGIKPIIVASGVLMALTLPLLTLAGSPIGLGLALLVFGAALGGIDVAMNIHAVEVEKAADKPLMSGFHGLFSVGGFAGATTITFLLSIGLGLLAACILSSFLMLIAIGIAAPRLLNPKHSNEGAIFAIPKGIVLLLAILAAITFLVEGAILDWSALLITGNKLVVEEQGGLGYILFSIAMVTGRFTGDAITARLGDRNVMFWGGLLTLTGFAVLLLAPAPLVALSGFILIGLGASNIVPVLFRRAGSQTTMPSSMAIAAITTMGYAGILAGPASIGFVSQAVGLNTSFWMLTALFCLVPLFAFTVTRKK